MEPVQELHPVLWIVHSCLWSIWVCRHFAILADLELRGYPVRLTSINNFLLSTFEARFDVNPELSKLLLDNASHWSWGFRKAWNFRFRNGLSEQSAYAELVRLGFTSAQVGSILKFVDMRFSAMKELKKYEFKNLQLAIEKRQSVISTKNRKIQSLNKRLDN